MAERRFMSGHLDRRSTSDPAADILMSKIGKDSTKGSSVFSRHSSPHSLPFLSPPATPTEPGEIPYKATEEDYFSLSQHSQNLARNYELDSGPDLVTISPNKVRDWSEHSQTNAESLKQVSNDPLANTAWNIGLVDRLCPEDNQNNGGSLSSQQQQAKSQESDSENGHQGRRPEQNGVVQATSQKTKNIAIVQGQGKISQSRQTGPKDAPAMIILRKASQTQNRGSSSRRSSIFQRTNSDSPPIEKQDTTSEEASSTYKESIRLLIKSYSHKIPRRTSVAKTALTLVNAHATLVGSDDAPSNVAERRNSAIAVVVTEQGSHEIIWRFDDTPSSSPSPTGSQNLGQRTRDTIQQPKRSDIRV
ncbi:MAG: hypothetical protein GOMPHAMPRED_003707 [Gomphillus americanus]|uniref:Uncharacterized protein n=1 Tax=Gomphillus americanus TaxID=1940652 RepID=A0A8H3FHU4_9LECA|nr:MAG: hypothetical protein GOMPHAMPRED_003707 [Gomphillus americanus]